jgi:hypothetical protein
METRIFFFFWSHLNLISLRGKGANIICSKAASVLNLALLITHNLITSIAIHLSLVSLAEHPHIAGITFLAGLLNNNIDSPVLLSLICFTVPSRSSNSKALSYVPHATNNYMANEPLRRLMSFANTNPAFEDLQSYKCIYLYIYCTWIDFFFLLY